MAAVMVATLMEGTAVAAPTAPEGDARPAVSAADKPIKGGAPGTVVPRTVQKEPRTPVDAPDAAWPAPAEATADLGRPAGARSGTTAQLKGLPLRLTTAASAKSGTGAKVKRAAAGEVEARVLDRAAARRAGVGEGLLFTLEASDVEGAGEVGVTLDYSDFAETFGGGYGARLTLVELPACALTKPDSPECVAAPVPAANDTERQTLSAPTVQVKAGTPTVLAAVADDQGETGDWTATPLSPSATWDTSLNSGDFNWSYEVPVPEVPGELAPEVALDYSSATIDGRTSSTNNQSSWVGDGFDLQPGAIERRYKTCADDDVKNADGLKPPDLCWGYDNAFITFGGKGGELVPTGKDDEFRLQRDDGTRIKRLQSANRGNGDNDGEYWRLTDPQGTRYYFGYHRLPGWTEGKETTDSTWTVPVYGDDKGEPCHASAFADSWCQQAWRWNLDYAVDTHGNAIAYYYNQEKNSYGRNLKAKDSTPYVRGGHLERIEYGLTSDKMYGAKALARVNFTSSERCIPNSKTDCSSISKDSFYWYDTPWDMNCPVAGECDKGRLAPTFWTRKRLTGITTQVLNGSSYADVDSWKLGHRWGQADVDYQLLLDSVQRTGHTASPAVTLPKTTFAYTQLENRLDRTGDGYAPFVKGRLSTVADEYGGQLDIAYSAPACKVSSTPVPHENTTRCFPQLTLESDTAEPEVHWFNKYVTTSVTSTDRTGGAPDMVTVYDYLDGASWHYDDDDGLTKEKTKTWSQWRGHGHVRVKTGGQGGASALTTQEDHFFLRGMDGDRKTPSGGTKSVKISLAEGEGDQITDHESLVGFPYKTATYSGPGGKILEKTIERPWHHRTATRVRDWGTLTANLTGTGQSRSYVSLDKGAGTEWRTTSVSTTHDTVTGRPVKVDDRGDTTTAADNQCVRTEYPEVTDANVLALPSREETVSVACDVSPDRAKDVVSDVRTAYDGGGYGAAPTKGDATSTAILASHDGTTAEYTESGTKHDAYGRVVATTDLAADVKVKGNGTPTRTPRADGLTHTTSYAPATGLPATVTKTTPPAAAQKAATAQTTVTTLDPRRSLPTAEKDTNGRTTAIALDALGRTSKVWLPDRKTSQTASYAFTYVIEEGKPVAVRTQTLDRDGKHLPGFTLYDGMLRTRQTQSSGPDGGRLLTDTFYDERGLVSKTFAPYYAEGAPTGSLFRPADALSVEKQTRHSYDGLGRETEVREIAGNGDGGAVLGITRTMHGGDRITVVPPEGGTAVTKLTDVRGNLTEMRQHHSRSADAAYDRTRYAYTPAGRLAKVTDPAGNVWSYTYDQRGRQTISQDPDKGTVTSAYDDRDRLIRTTDAREKSLHHTYDQLGRRTELRDSGPEGTLRASWEYDSVVGAKGQLASTTRYENGAAYTSRVMQYDALYRSVRTAVVIPAREGALAGTYMSGTTFNIAGLPDGVTYSAAGSLPGGSYSYSYDATLRPVALNGDGFRAETTYSLTGKPLQYSYGATAQGAPKAFATRTYERGTGRLATARVDRQDATGVDQSLAYRYDQAGNILSIADSSRAGTDNQCFAYDHLRRLTQAWTEADTSCEEAPSGTAVGGLAPYWQSFTYDEAGNRGSETRHDPGGDTTKDIQRKYTYPSAGNAGPHTLTGFTETGPDGQTESAYRYDGTGNTTARSFAGAEDELTWDSEGLLARVKRSVGGKDSVTEYLYDSDGGRLITREEDRTVLHLGATELTLDKDAQKPKATRYIDLGNGNQAVQTDDGAVVITLADMHGTGQLAISVKEMKLTQRRFDPFGAIRQDTGPQSWPGSKGFVGGFDSTESTGLVRLGARDYDPNTGRFLSVDPLLDLTDPQQQHGYTYANNNPTSYSDPTGLAPCKEGIFTYCGTCPIFATNCKPGKDSSAIPKTTPKCNVCLPAPNPFQPSRSVWKPSKSTAPAKGSGSRKPTAPAAPKEKERETGTFLDELYNGAAMGRARTHGLCIDLSSGTGFMGNVSGCFLATEKKDGGWEFGLSGTAGASGAGAGSSAGLSYLHSNADKLEQLSGWGVDGEVSAHFGVGAALAQERSVNLDGTVGRNFLREPVWADTFGVGVGVEAGVEAGINHTWTWTF
ncbi:RHS repeat-associated core domain-containing protein [Streptomyces albidoflavus]